MCMWKIKEKYMQRKVQTPFYKLKSELNFELQRTVND